MNTRKGNIPLLEGIDYCDVTQSPAVNIAYFTCRKKHNQVAENSSC